MKYRSLLSILILYISLFGSSCGVSPVPEKSLFSIFDSTLYIKIVDQNGKPVKGAKLLVSHGEHGFLRSNIVVGEYFTDKQGNVEILLDGRAIEISQISAEGYHVDFKTQIERLIKVANTGYAYRGQKIGNPDGRLREKEMRRYCNKDTPFIFQAYKYNTLPDLFMGEAELKFEYGKPRRFSFNQSRMQKCRGYDNPNSYCPEKDSWESSGDFDLEMTIKSSSLSARSVNNGYRSWSLEINIPSGGIQETHDLYFYQAPKLGYKAQWRGFFSDLEPAKRQSYGSSMKFYTMLEKEGVEKFGRIYIKVNTWNKNYAEVNLEYFFSKKDWSSNILSKPKRYKYPNGKESVDLNYEDTIPTKLLFEKFNVSYNSIYELSDHAQTYYTINNLMPIAYHLAEEVRDTIIHQLEIENDDTIVYDLAEIVSEKGWRDTKKGRLIPSYDKQALLNELKRRASSTNFTDLEYELAMRLALNDAGGTSLLSLGWR